jgi:hypothetical protein
LKFLEKNMPLGNYVAIGSGQTSKTDSTCIKETFCGTPARTAITATCAASTFCVGGAAAVMFAKAMGVGITMMGIGGVTGVAGAISTCSQINNSEPPVAGASKEGSAPTM